MKLHHLAVVPLLLVALSGCAGEAAGDDGIASAQGGTTSAQPTSTPTATPTADGLRFAQCMRENGVEVPDPDPNSSKPMISIDRSDPKVKAAVEKCKQHLPVSDGSRTFSPEDQQRLLDFAKCMRDHGINVPDPDPNGGKAITGFNPNDPKMKAAMEACRQQAPRRPQSS